MKSTLEATEEALATVREIAHRHEVRLSTWVAVANAGALLFCFNAMLNHAICDWPAFRPLIFIFAAGLASAYISVWAALRGEQRSAKLISEIASLAIHYEGLKSTLDDINQTDLGSLADQQLADHQDRLEALHAEHDRHAGRVETIKRRSRFRGYEFTSNIGLTVSALSFATALVAALTLPSFVGALCAV